ncbi:MAG: hypothetical protein AB8G26_10120 [Ilumatobacter sp.]
MTLLSTIEPTEQLRLGDAVRAIGWSATGRTIAIGADGRALLGGDGRLTGPIGPDPLDCAWINSERVAVIDSMIGVVTTGGGSIHAIEIAGALQVLAPTNGPDSHVAREHHCVVVGATGLTTISADPRRIGRPTTIDTGPLRTAVHLGGSVWLGGGRDGLVVVDVALGCIDQRVEHPSIVSLAAAPSVGRVAAADASGAIHVLETGDLENGTELTGYPDAVRHLGIDPSGATLVACADDELTWWSVHDDGRVVDEPEATVGHAAAITACANGTFGFVTTGDADGVVRLWSPRLRDLPVARPLAESAGNSPASTSTATPWPPPCRQPLDPNPVRDDRRLRHPARHRRPDRLLRPAHASPGPRDRWLCVDHVRVVGRDRTRRADDPRGPHTRDPCA